MKTKIISMLLILLFIAPAIAESGKVFILNFHYEDNELTFIDKTIKYGHYPDRKIQPQEGHTLNIINRNNIVLYSFRFEIPDKAFTDIIKDNKTMGGVIVLDKTDFSIVVPYFDDVYKINIYNERDRITLSIIIKEGFNKNTIYVALIIIIIALITAFVLFRRKKKRWWC